MIVTVNSAVGLLEVTARYVSPIELEVIGGPAARLEVKPAGLAHFVIDGNPYGGHFLAGLDCVLFASFVYRAGVGGPARGWDHAGALRDALRDAVAPHLDAIRESLRAQQRDALEEAVTEYESEARRLRVEADKLEHRASAWREWLSAPRVDGASRTCEAAADDLDPTAPDPDPDPDPKNSHTA